MVLADIFKRWSLLRREPAQLLTGTDEHGMKIQRAAEQAEADTFAFCTQHAQQFQSLAEAANISHDRFFRTTDSDHKDAVTYFWQELERQGYIYEAKHEGWYCVSDETFYPESQVHAILVPRTGEKIMASKETGKEVVWTSEINYHFKLSAFRDKLLKHYKGNPDFIIPRARMNFIVKEVESGLSDLSISRPKERLAWGIRVPGDSSQTIYVWFDALINYITHAGYPFSPPDEHGCWPPDLQIIGKDIIRFHTIYWPAFLMALRLPLPKQFLSHAHWTMNTAKMSKSLGNVVNPFSALSRYGVDTIRYFLARDGGIADDSPYDNSRIVARYVSELQGQIGNLVVRISRTLKWDFASCVQYGIEELRRDGSEGLRPHGFDVRRQELRQAVEDYDEAMRKLDLRRAMELVIEIVRDGNRLLQEKAPWKETQEKVASASSRTKWIIFEAAETVRVAMILLQPFMPGTMKLGLDMIGVPAEHRFLTDDLVDDIPDYGVPLIDLPKGKAGTLFPPLLCDT